MLLLVMLAGIATWTLAEYLLHRFLGHVHKGKNFFKAEHQLHHAKANYFAPAYKKALLAAFSISLMVLFISLFTTVSVAVAFTAGFAGMYLLYEATHYRYHAAEPIAMPFVALRKHHFYHHFHNPKMNHGVTTRLWDRVFGTFRTTEQVNIPRQMQLNWLMEGDHIKPAYAQHFRLTGRQ